MLSGDFVLAGVDDARTRSEAVVCSVHFCVDTRDAQILQILQILQIHVASILPWHCS